MPLNADWIFVFLIVTASQCFADDDHELDEFLKREYSLSKPYQGNATVRNVLMEQARRASVDSSRNHVFDNHFEGYAEICVK